MDIGNYISLTCFFFTVSWLYDYFRSKYCFVENGKPGEMCGRTQNLIRLIIERSSQISTLSQVPFVRILIIVPTCNIGPLDRAQVEDQSRQVLDAWNRDLCQIRVRDLHFNDVAVYGQILVLGIISLKFVLRITFDTYEAILGEVEKPKRVQREI